MEHYLQTWTVFLCKFLLGQIKSDWLMDWSHKMLINETLLTELRCWHLTTDCWHLNSAGQKKSWIESSSGMFNPQWFRHSAQLNWNDSWFKELESILTQSDSADVQRVKVTLPTSFSRRWGELPDSGDSQPPGHAPNPPSPHPPRALPLSVCLMSSGPLDLCSSPDWPAN